MSVKSWIVGVVLLAAAVAPVAAQDAGGGALGNRMTEQIEVEWESDESIATYRGKVMAELAGAATDAVEDKAQDIAEKQPGTVGAADGFGTRLGESLTNFLPLLGFAVDAVNVSDDDKAVVVDFNPLRVGPYGAVKLNATVSEPLPSKGLLEAIEASARSAQEKAIQEGLEDFDDITWTASYGYQREAAPARSGDSAPSNWYWGRHPRLYQHVIGELMSQIWAKAIPAEDQSLAGFFEEVLVDSGIPFPVLESRGAADWTPAQLGEHLSAPQIEELRDRVVREAIRESRIEERLAAFDLEKIGHMIDNQPQLVVNGAYRDRDELIGPDVVSVTVKAELGLNNLNSLLRQRRGGKTLLEAYENALESWDVLSKDRFALSFTYIDRDEHRVSLPYELATTDPDSGEQVTFPRTASLDLPSASEIHGKVQYSRSIKRQPVTIEGEAIYPRVDFVLEYVDVEDDPTRQDRGVAELGLNFPVRGGLSIPLTISWANHAEFLGEADDQLGAHVGISYGLDRLFE